MKLPKRKNIRLAKYDYSTPGAYFITICVKDRKNLLGNIVGNGVLDGPQNTLSNYGKIAEKHILKMSDFYDYLSVDKYVIMPNHIHLLVRIFTHNGPSGTPVPTSNTISRFLSTFKRFCNKEYWKNIWQYRSFDHIIRDENDYKRILEYIDTNPLKWREDCFYTD